MMKQSTSFAQVATNLLNVLQGCSKTIRLLLVMLLTLTVTTNAWGALSSPYECVFKTTSKLTNNQVTTGDVTWTLSTTIGAGTPATDFGNTNGQSAIKLGSGKKNYYSKMTLTTSAFSTYNVSKVVLYISSNNGGSKTITVKQGNTQIGTGSQNFTSTDWVTNCTRNTTKGSGGDLSIEISSDATATFIHSITVTYEETSCSVKPTVGATLQSLSTTENSITATIPISSIGGCNITENGLVYSTTNSTPTVGGSGCTKVTTTACGSTAANKTVTITGLTCGQSYYIRGYATNEAGTSYTNVTTKSTSDCPKYTVTLKDDNSTLTQITAGGSVTLPPREGCEGYTFAGWTKSWKEEQEVWTTTAPTIIPAGSYTPTANENLYPVYTKTEGGGSEPTAYSAGDVGSFIIASNVSDKWYAIPENPTLSSGKITGVEITVSQTAGGVKYVSTANAEGYTWTIADATNGQTISDGTKYIYHSNGGASETNLTYGTSTSYTWKIEKENNGLTFKGMNGSTINSRGLLFKGSVFGGYALSNEDASGYYRIQVLPIGGGSTTYYISVPDCTTEPSVSFDLNGGSGTFETETLEDGDSYTIPEIEPTRDGYNFAGWKIQYGDETIYKYGTTNSTIQNITADITLVAQWTAKTTSITLDANTSNNGSGTNSSVTATYDQALPEFTACTPATGYTLNGYYTAATNGTMIIDKEGKLVSNVADYTSNEGKWKNESAELTLYAQYTINSYTVTFDNQEHGIKPDNQTITHGEKVTKPVDLTESGLIFGGWYKEAECTNAWDFENDVVTSSITLYAKWTAKTATSLTWLPTSYSATIDADNTFPELTKSPADLSPIAYSSSNTDVATIDANTGEITLVAAGTTTIKATFTETNTHAGSTASYTLTVNPSNCRWLEIALEDITPEDEIVVTMGNDEMGYALGTEKITNSPKSQAITITSGMIDINQDFDYSKYTWSISAVTGGYTLQPYGTTDTYLYGVTSYISIGNNNTNNVFTIFTSPENGNKCFMYTIEYTPYYLGHGTENKQTAWTRQTSYNILKSNTLKFYKRECLDASKVWVEGNLTNVTCSPQLPQQLAKDGSIELTFTAADGYVLPNDVTVSNNATETWDQETGKLTISNPTGNVMVTVEADKQHTITWNIAGDETLKTYVVEGSQVELPDLDNDPTSCSDTYTTFVGWYTEPSSMETNPSAEPQGEQVTASTVPTGNATYYAVWADGSGAGGEEVKATLNFSTNDWELPEGSSNKETEEASYSNGTYTIKLAGPNGYYWNSTSSYLIFGKNGATLTFPKFTFKVSKIEVTGTSSASELVQQNIYVGENAVSTTTVGAKNVTNIYEIASEYQTIGSIYQLKVISDHNSQLTQIQVFSSTPAATGYISSCCQSQAVVTVTPVNTNLELNIDGTASTTVNISQTGGGNGKYYEPTVSPADGASLDWAALGVTYKQTAYDISFTATKAGTYTVTGNFTETSYDCQKTGSATINVVANPILQVSEPTITSECGTEGTPVAVTIDSRYLIGASLTAQVATTTDTEHGVFKICTTEDGDFATTDLTGLTAGQESKASVTIYVRYDAAVDNIDAATGTLTITDGTTSQTITLTTTPICGTSIRMTPTDANSVRVTTANGQWTRTKTPIHLSGSYLLQNLTGDQGAKVELTSSNPNFKFVKPDVESSGTVKYESEKITNNTWDADVYLVYTPTTYNANETTIITAKVITFGGTTEHATATMNAYGRSFPETFVLALNTGSEWVALPADMIAPYGTNCTTGIGNHDPYPIGVNDNANPTAATLAPARAVYKGAARNTPMTNPWTVQFESNTQAGYYLFGSIYNDGANTSIANLAQATGEGLKWELKTEDNITYRLSQMSASAVQLGYNATTNYMGQYQSTANNFKYDFRILPVTNTCTYYIEPVMTLVDYTDDEAKVRIQYDGTNLYQISMDNKANWTNITGEIDCKDLTFTLPNATYRGQNVWLKPQGDLCEEVVSSVACHIPAPVINHPGNQNFIGTANQLFNGTFTITGNDLYEDVSAINITTNSNPAIGATISNGTITITMAASPVGTYTTNITFDAVGAEEVTVKVTIEITSGRVITWMANGIEYEKTEVGEGASPVLPTEPSPDDYACGTKEFVGWTTIAEITDGLEPDPLITDASQITNDMDTLYAVFADCITNHKPKDEYVLVTDINKLKAGDKIIFAYTPSEYVAGDFLDDSSNDLSVDGTATFSKTQPLVIPSTETLIFTLGGSAGAWTFTTLDGRKLGAVAEKELSLTTEGSGITTWNIHSISTANGDADIEPSTTTTYGKLTYISVFSLYKENSGPKKPQIYKRVVGEEDIDDVTKHRIQLSVLDEITYDEEVREDISFVLPASVGSVGCDGKVFVGWTTTADLTSTSEPADFYDKGVSVLVTEPKTYYAVFATESKNASTSNITLNYNTLGITGSYTQGEPTVSGYTFVVTGYRNSTDYFQMKRDAGDGILYNKTPIPNMKSITVTISGSEKEYAIYENDVFNDYEDYGNPITPEGTTGTATANVNAGNEYFTLKVEEDGTVNISSVVIEYYPATYSDYTTDCIAITKYNVTHTLTGVESSSNNPTIVTDTDTDLWLEYTTQTGYTFPEEISITMGGFALSSSEYEWDDENGALYIEPANGFTGDVNITITAEQSTDVFTKVTSAPADWSGEYLIVYDAGNVALDGSTNIKDADNNIIDVARNDAGDIYADNTTLASSFTIIPKSGGGFAIKSKGGKYIGQTEYNNGFLTSDSYQYTNQISFENDNASITSDLSGGTVTLRYNKDAYRFRYYKSGQQSISLYKRNTSASPLPARKSNVSAHASNAASKAYISPAARLSNAECIGYQNFTTQCSNVYVEEWDVDKIYIEAVEGMSSVELHSKKNSTYTHIATTTASRNADGTYTITATNGTTDLSDIACEKMRISIKDASNNVIAAQLYKVPIIVENAIKTNDNRFVTTLGASTCANCDVIIRDNAVLEHVAGGVNDFRNLTIYESAALRNEQTILSVEDLLIRSKRDDVGYAIIEKDNGFISANTVAHTKRIDAAYWYTFALPYDCKIADITQANGKSMGDYGTHWGIKYYDGQARQASGTTAGQGNSSQFWEPMPADGVLEANHGYIIALFDASVQDDNEMRTIYFPPAENKEYTESGTGSKATTIVNWTDNLECDQQHHGWNFTSTPYISIFNPSEMADNEDGAGMNASNVLMTGKINLVDGSYYEETLEDVYVSIPSTQGAKYYDQQLASSTSLMPFSAYFVQAVDPETGSSETKTLTYAKGARTLPTSAPARAAATKQRVLVELKTTAPDGQTDNTGVWVDERYTTNYEIAADLTKMYATGTKPQLYTWANNQRMAYNALPDNAATYVPLGLYAPVAGNYMIAINQRVSRLQGAESVELLYNNAVVANLLVQDYILTANQGENNGYALRVNRKAQVSTATDNISGSTITLIANDGYISLTGVPTDAKVNIYDMLGRLIATQNADGQTIINMPMIPQGVYNIVINSTNGHQTMKTIIR